MTNEKIQAKLSSIQISGKPASPYHRYIQFRAGELAAQLRDAIAEDAAKGIIGPAPYAFHPLHRVQALSREFFSLFRV